MKLTEILLKSNVNEVADLLCKGDYVDDSFHQMEGQRLLDMARLNAKLELQDNKRPSFKAYKKFLSLYNTANPEETPFYPAGSEEFYRAEKAGKTRTQDPDGVEYILSHGGHQKVDPNKLTLEEERALLQNLIYGRQINQY